MEFQKCKMNNINYITEEWLKDLLKIDGHGSAPEVSVPLLCQKIVMKKGRKFKP
jgi:hypothetical protein